ncbi:Pre-rRNA-processing protein esf1 [Podospora aff. communis PSN243]|uniref:Pre-rRNA-processing protein esf1 n=1 Tax=Podospora aff. communis PSN243 TaxID=3040156 RepID=A0AAV9GJR5_9PEZI|nr:Pre-rRNA-processing protein esf1 [Podospora aff. communis PSN243]
MPKPKPPKRDGAASSIKDARFANFETDPRYQLPSKKTTKTKLDKRFSRVLTDPEFTATAKVDRYGRKLKTDSKKKALQRLYEVEDEEEDKDSDVDEVEDAEVEDDDIVRRELEAAEEKYDPARGGGFASSESDSDSDSDSEAEVEDDGEEEARPGIRPRKDAKAVETGEVTNRVAIVNIDWDHIKSVDLMALFSSFVPPGGRIEKVSIYPSEFGKERMQREELEGPPKEIFKQSNDDDDDSGDDSAADSDDDAEKDSDYDSDEEVKKELLQEGNDQDFDSDKLRTYQLDRLRYYYAVMVCSDENTAHKIYEATDGSEYLSSSNFLDLRFVPDDVTFDDEPRDECESVPPGYKPMEFVTDALQHSKVKLTWDMHPEEATRKESIRQAFTGSRADIADNDLRAYLASDSEDEDESEEEDEVAAVAEQLEAEAEEPKLTKKELARRKMRAALGLGDEPAPKSAKSSGPVGEMQITFTSALSTKDSKKDPEEETTIEKYKRKEKERKERKRAEMLARRNGGDAKPAEEAEDAGSGADDLGFDDPFFTTEGTAPSKASIRKEERLKKRAAKEAEEAENAAEREKLRLVMGEDAEGGNLDHFDMKEIMRAEKLKNKKKQKKGAKGVEDQGGLQEDFSMDVKDDRFKAVFESHEFAIDPSNPKFKATEGMKKLLEEGRKKRKAGHDDEPTDRTHQRSSKKAKGQEGGGELDSLINSVKRKAGKGRR